MKGDTLTSVGSRARRISRGLRPRRSGAIPVGCGADLGGPIQRPYDLPIKRPPIANAGALQALRLRLHDCRHFLTRRATLLGMTEADEVAYLVIDQIGAIVDHSRIPVIGCATPPIRVECHDLTVLTAHRSSCLQREAELVDPGSLGEHNLKPARVIGDEGEPGLWPTSRIVEHGKGERSQIGCRDISNLGSK